MKPILSLSLSSFLMIAACASNDEPGTASRAMQETRSGAARAAMTPLRDLNLHRDPIPEVLQEIGSPYDISPDIGCADIRRQIDALNEVLGPDWDALPGHETDPTISDYAADEVSEELVDIIADEAGALIPYRSWVRRITGAKSHQKKVNRAEKRGGHRRTYLKALGTAKQCDGIYVPQPVLEPFETEPPQPQVAFRTTAPPQYRFAQTDTSEPFRPGQLEEEGEFRLDQPAQALTEEEAYDWPEAWGKGQWQDEGDETSPPSRRTSSSPSDD